MSVRFRVIVEVLILLIIVAVIAKQFQQPVISFINTFGETQLASSEADGETPPRSRTSRRCTAPGVCGSGCYVEPGQQSPPGCGEEQQPGAAGTPDVDPDIGGETFFATPRQLNILVYFGIIAGAITLVVLLIAIRPTVASVIAGMPVLHFAILFLIVVSSVMLALIKVFDAKDMMTIFSGVVGYTIGRAVARSRCPEPAPAKPQQNAGPITPASSPEPAPTPPAQSEAKPPASCTPDEQKPGASGTTEASTKCKTTKTGKNKVVQVFIQ